jgi:hypothetical protein
MNATQLCVDGCRIIVGGAVALLLEAGGSGLVELEAGGLYYVFNGWSRMVDSFGDRPNFCYSVACDIPPFFNHVLR